MPVQREQPRLSPANTDYPRIERALNDREWISEWRIEEVMDFDGRSGRWFEGRFTIQRKYDYQRYINDGRPPFRVGEQFEPELRIELTCRTYDQVVAMFWGILEGTKDARHLDVK